ncbi:type I secretion membrane fusion protein, HlyD family [Corchorus olitorius]|uniref:Type I secretion membrane fusion protein, HlyD family n=1 Tax=Corchorus olitorius TaxID=93759 RepID=A0A1R3HTF6_9ROSI|nr:type I secretion membrane fusion protein, HlyD family [Corchorus olitorius]
MEKSSDLESQLAKVEENLVLILESINKGKEEAKFPEGKRLDVEVRLDFIEKLARKIKVVAFKDKDEINPQLVSKKLSKLRIECGPEVEKEEIKLDKRRFEEFELQFEKQLEDQQKLNEELKEELGQVKQKQKIFDQYLAAKKSMSTKNPEHTRLMERLVERETAINRMFMQYGSPGQQIQQVGGIRTDQKNVSVIPKKSRVDAAGSRKRPSVEPCLPLEKKVRFRSFGRTGGVKEVVVPFEHYTQQLPQQLSLLDNKGLIVVDVQPCRGGLTLRRKVSSGVGEMQQGELDLRELESPRVSVNE